MTPFDAGAGARRVHAPDLPLDWEPVAPGQVVSGDPRVGAAGITAADGVEVGVWAHTVGVSTDVEADEVFVVLSGRARIDLEDGTALEVGPGDVGILPPGARTRWTIHEDLRKVYVIRTET
jgi:uncharacterized cupin superfamily protein